MQRSAKPGLRIGALLIVATALLGIGMWRLPAPALAAPHRDLPTATPPPPTVPPPPAESPTATPPPPALVEEPPEDPPRRMTPTATPIPTLTATPIPTPDLPPPTDLRIIKLVDRQEVTPGDRVTFTLRVETTLGGSPVTDVVVRDYIPEPLEVIDLTADRGDIVLRDREVVAFPAQLEPGAVIHLRIVTRVPDSVEPGAIVNTAMVTTSTRGDDPGNNTSSVIVRILPPPARAATPPPPRFLPRTANPDAPVLWMVVLPWALVGILAGVAGLAVRAWLRRWPLARIPTASASPATPTASASPATPTASASPATPTASTRPTPGAPLPPARPPESLPPLPGIYVDGEDAG